MAQILKKKNKSVHNYITRKDGQKQEYYLLVDEIIDMGLSSFTMKTERKHSVINALLLNT